jgi:Flp pilus assembly protein TadB
MNRDDRHPHVTAQIERLRQARRRHAEMFRRAIEAGLPLDKALDEAARQFDAEMDRE